MANYFQSLLNLKEKFTELINQKATLQALIKGGNHQGFFLKLLPHEYVPLKDFKSMNFILVLDGVTDVETWGQSLRTSYSLGIEGFNCFKYQKTVNNSEL